MKSIVFLIVILFCNAVFAEIQSVEVLDREFQPIHVVSEKNDLVKFQSIWMNKSEVTPQIPVRWSEGYKIDISGGENSGRWLYYDGWLKPLSMKSINIYRIQDYKQFELLIGLRK